MLDRLDSSSRTPSETDRLSGTTLTFTHPDDVLHSGSLSVDEKRALLASWASDAHAVPDSPALRQLESGAIVDVDTVLAALRVLDAGPRTARTASAGLRDKRRLSLVPRWRHALSRRSRDGDDDDPPPCPAAALAPGVELELRRRRDKAWQLAAA